MPRTTLNIDASVLRELKRLKAREGKSLGELVSELLAVALARREDDAEPQAFRWRTQRMCARVDLEDEDALYAALDER